MFKPTTPASVIAADMAVLVRIGLRDHEQYDSLAWLERLDFDEQFAYAEDDEQRIGVCKRWLKADEANQRARRWQYEKQKRKGGEKR